jgi:Ca-activated chloride channel homolog
VRPRPDAAASDELLTVKLRYKAPEGESSSLIEQPVRDGGLELPRASDDFRFAAAVAEWGVLLRDSRFRGTSTFSSAAELARGAIGHDEHGYRAEFLRLVDESRRLANRGDPSSGTDR